MEPRNDQEIDLLELLAKLFRAIRRNALSGFLFIVIGILFSIGLSFLFKEVKRESHMMIVTDLLTEKEAKFLFDQLNKADTLPGLANDEEREVVKISYEVLKGEGGQVEPKVFIEVTAQVNDPKIFPVLEKTIISYLNKSEPVIRNRKVKTKLYTEMIRKIDHELEAMDQVKNNVGDQKNTYLDPSELFAKSVDLYEKRTKYEIDLEELKTIKMVKGFGTLSKNAKVSKTIVALIGFAVGLVGFFFYLALKAFSEYYRKFETSA